MPTDFLGLVIYVYFLPGIAGYFIYETFAETMPRQATDKVAMALTLTLASTIASGYVFDVPFFPNFLAEDIVDPDAFNDFVLNNLWITTTVACAQGIILAWLRNRGWIFFLLHRIGVTKRTGTIDPWHQVFSKYRRRWLLIKFQDGSQLVGWPKYYSENGSRKELFLASATWYIPLNISSNDIHINSEDEAGSGITVGNNVYKQIDSDGEGILITNFDRVMWIEISKPRP